MDHRFLAFFWPIKVTQLKTGFWLSFLIFEWQDVKVTTLKSEDFDKKRALFDKFVEEKGFSGWYETSGRLNIWILTTYCMSHIIWLIRPDLIWSQFNFLKAKENININEAATKLIEKVIENESKLAPPRKLYDLLWGAITRLTSNDLWRSLDT